MKVKEIKDGQIVKDFEVYCIMTPYIDGAFRKGVNVETGEDFSFFIEEDVEVIDINLKKLINNRLKWEGIIEQKG